jgi:hypothetical protein
MSVTISRRSQLFRLTSAGMTGEVGRENVRNHEIHVMLLERQHVRSDEMRQVGYPPTGRPAKSTTVAIATAAQAEVR